DAAHFTFEDVSSRDDIVRPGFTTVLSRLAEYYREFLQSSTARANPNFPFLAEGFPPWMVLGRGMSAANDTQDSFRELRDGCEFVGQLSAADGALLLTESLNVYAMGAKLKVDDIKSVSLRLASPDDLGSLTDERIRSLPEYSEPRGSRFKSAVLCCRRLPAGI